MFTQRIQEVQQHKDWKMEEVDRKKTKWECWVEGGKGEMCGAVPGKKMMVGKPFTFTSGWSTSLAVASIFAMTTESMLANLAPNWS